MSRELQQKGRGSVEKALEGWLAAGLIDAALAERLRAHDSAQHPVETGRWTRLAFGFGGLLLAAGVFLFVAANWQELSPWQRFAIVLTVVAALHLGAACGAGFSRALGTTLHAAGTAALGAGIFLAGQIFNLQEHWPNAFLLWALGAGLAALLLKDWPQVTWVAVLAPLWLAAEWATHFPWYRVLSGVAIEAVLPFGVVILSVAYLAAPARDLDSAWRRALARLGAAGVLLTAGSLAGFDTEGLPVPDDAQPLPAWLLGLGWSVAIALPLLLALWLRGRQAWPVVVAAALAALVILLDASITWQRLLMYLLYATASVGLVGWGLLDGERLRVNVGVFGFVMTVLTFYFSDLFDMLGRSFGLIGLGLLCIGGGWLAERGRRRLLARLEREAAP